MAKKKTVKTAKKRPKKEDRYPLSVSEEAIDDAVARGILVERKDPIKELHSRIDAIVSAIDKSKSVRGL